MKYIIITLLLLSSAFAESNTGPHIMFDQWIGGIVENDLRKFKHAYQNEFWQNLSNKQKQRMLDTYRNAFKNLGHYKKSDFSVSYDGDEKVGTLTIKFKNRKIRALKVMQIKGDWFFVQS